MTHKSVDTERFPYRLSIHASAARFRPEIAFACDFLEHCHPLRRDGGADVVLHYGPEPPPGAVAVPSAVFPGCVSVAADGLRPDRAALARAEAPNGALLPSGKKPGASDGYIAYDALGLIFLLLSRLEERGSPRGDRYGRFPITESLLHRHGALDVPLADLAARDLAGALLRTDEPPTLTRYRVWLTHDLDGLRGYHRPLAPLRAAAGDLLKRRRPRQAAQRLRRAYLSGEPWRSCRRIMALSERHDLKSRFYFMGPSDHPMDSPYMLRQPALARRLADEIVARGHHIGFHPGFGTHQDREEWQAQRAGLEEITGRPVSEGRQHVLMFDVESTWDIWNDAGMAADATLGYPERSGFRSGTCRSHPAFSLRRRRPLALVERPTALMDFGLFGGKYRRLTLEQALSESLAVVETCRKHGGDLVVLFHTGQSGTTAERWYEELIARL